MAEALYRKYRPQVFEDVVGQESIQRTLKNAIDQDKVSHAYLFCGPRGTGKTTMARLLAKALLCEHGPTSSPDGSCQDCLDVAEGQHPDVYELDAASRTGVENVREEIIGRVNFAPTRGKKKVYIIDEVHMLSTAAFNALLKTLEEPPAHVVFVLCTTDPQKVPATIHSRCQRFDFHRLGIEEIRARLALVCMAEEADYEEDALDLIAQRAEGGMRNALTSLEQLIAFGEGNVTLSCAQALLGSLDSAEMVEIMNAVGNRDAAACFKWTADYVESGADLAQFTRDMAQRVRNAYVLSLAGADAPLGISSDERRQLLEELRLFGPDRLARLLGVLGDLQSELRTAINPRLCFEIALTRMVRPDSDLTLEALAERIEALEAGKSAVATYIPAGANAASAPLPVQATPVQSGDFAQNRTSAPAAFEAPAPSVQMPSPARNAQAPNAQRPASVAMPANASQAQMGTAAASPVRPAAPKNPVPPVVTASQAVPAPAAPQTQAASGAVASAVPAQGGTLRELLGNPAALQRAWHSVVAAVKKESVSYGVLFVNVKARLSQDGESVLIEFPAGNPFAFTMANKPEAQACISRAFNQVLGQPVAFSCVQAEGQSRQAVPSAAMQTAASNRPAPAAAPSPSRMPAPAPVAAQPAAVPQKPAPVQAPMQNPVQTRPPMQVNAPAQVQAPSPAKAPADIPPWEEPATPVAASDFDEVPLDMYDDVAYGVDAEYADAGFAAAPVPAPAKVQQAVPSIPGAASVSTQKEDFPTSGGQNAASAEDMGKMLSGLMGANVIFEEENN